MKLFKPPGQETWHVEVETENGERKTLDTECLSKKEAEEIVDKAKIRELEAASKAHRLTSEVVTLITANRNITLLQAISEWESWMQGGTVADKTSQNNTIFARQFAREMQLGMTSISAITTDQIGSWINREEDTTKRGTRMVKLSALRGLFRFCEIKRYVLSDPSRLVRVSNKVMSHEQRETKHKRVFADDEIEFLLAKTDGAEPDSITPGFFRAAIILGRDLGLRLIDICNLEWTQFDFSKKTVAVWMEKTNSRIEIPLNGRVLRLVTKWQPLHNKFLFLNERRIINDTKERAKLSVYFSRFFARCGFEGYSYHSLRGSLATTMANEGRTMDEIAEALGHKKTGVTQAYVRKESASLVKLR